MAATHTPVHPPVVDVLRDTVRGAVVSPGAPHYDDARTRRYDPDNLFRLNQNIPPTTEGGQP